MLDVNPREFFLRQLFIGSEVTFDTSGLDCTQIAHVS